MQTLNWDTAFLSWFPSPVFPHLSTCTTSSRWCRLYFSCELSLCWFVSFPPASPEVVCSLWPLVCLQFCILGVFFGLCFASLFLACICVVQQPYNLFNFYLLFFPLNQLNGLPGTLNWLRNSQNFIRMPLYEGRNKREHQQEDCLFPCCEYRCCSDVEANTNRQHYGDNSVGVVRMYSLTNAFTSLCNICSPPAVTVGSKYHKKTFPNQSQFMWTAECWKRNSHKWLLIIYSWR